MDTTSWRVVRGAALGDHLARDEFARCYGGVITAYFAARWRRTALAEAVKDAQQEAFLECFREGGALQRVQEHRPGGFRAFLFGVLRNVALRVEQRHVRDGRLSLQEGTVLDGLAAAGDSATAVFDREWARALMREAIVRQTAEADGDAARRRVELLRLRFQERMPIRDIARHWQMDAAIVHHEYARARREFEKALRAVVAEHHPGSDEDIERTLHEVVRALGR